MLEIWVWFLGREDPLEGMATHSSFLAWRIPWTEEPGGLQSTGQKELDTLKWLSTHHSLRDSKRPASCPPLWPCLSNPLSVSLCTNLWPSCCSLPRPDEFSFQNLCSLLFTLPGILFPMKQDDFLLSSCFSDVIFSESSYPTTPLKEAPASLHSASLHPTLFSFIILPNTLPGIYTYCCLSTRGRGIWQSLETILVLAAGEKELLLWACSGIGQRCY